MTEIESAFRDAAFRCGVMALSKFLSETPETTPLSYTEKVVFQLLFYDRRPIRLWQRVLAYWGGGNGVNLMITTVVFRLFRYRHKRNRYGEQRKQPQF